MITSTNFQGHPYIESTMCYDFKAFDHDVTMVGSCMVYDICRAVYSVAKSFKEQEI